MKNNDNKAAYLYELKATYRAYFESQLAAYILRKHNQLDAVKKISKRILHLIKNNNSTTTQGELAPIFKIIMGEPKIAEELYNNYMFGRLGETSVEPQNILDVFKKILMAYLSPDNVIVTLEQVMHVHSVFAYRIYSKLPNKQITIDDRQPINIADEPSLSEVITYLANKSPQTIDILLTELTSDFKAIGRNPDRGRSALINNSAPCKTLLGNCNNCFFNNCLNKLSYTNSDHLHRPAMHIYQPDINSAYYQTMQDKGLPYIAGRSTHTWTFIHAATCFGNLSNTEMQEYFMAVAAYLIGGGNHTFDESAYIAHALANVPYVEGNYYLSMPQDIYAGLQNNLSQKYNNALLLGERFLHDDVSEKVYQDSNYYKQLVSKYLLLDKDIQASYANFNTDNAKEPSVKFAL